MKVTYMMNTPVPPDFIEALKQAGAEWDLIWATEGKTRSQIRRERWRRWWVGLLAQLGIHRKIYRGQ